MRVINYNVEKLLDLQLSSLCKYTLAELMYDERVQVAEQVQEYFNALFVKVV
jgi:hypothetical protein